MTSTFFFSRSSAAPPTAGFYSSWSRNENIISPKAQDESSSRSRTSISPRQGFPDSISRCSPVDVVGYLPSLMTSCWEVPTSRFLLSLSNSGQRPCCFAFDTAAPNHQSICMEPLAAAALSLRGSSGATTVVRRCVFQPLQRSAFIAAANPSQSNGAADAVHVHYRRNTSRGHRQIAHAGQKGFCRVNMCLSKRKPLHPPTRCILRNTQARLRPVFFTCFYFFV